MFIRDFQLLFTDTTKTQNAHQELLQLSITPRMLNNYISSFEHLYQRAGWGADDTGTMMLFKKRLTQGLHCVVLEKTNPHPIILHGWIKAACWQYKLWAQIKASLGGMFAKPSELISVELRKWRLALGSNGGGSKGSAGRGQYNHAWHGVCKEDRMDLNVAQVNMLTTEEKGKLQKEGQCFICKRMGHLSRNCPNKTKRDAPTPTQNFKSTTHVIKLEPENKNPKKAMAEQIKAISVEEWNILLDNLVLWDF